MQTLILKVDDRIYEDVLSLLMNKEGVIIEKPSQVENIRNLFKKRVKAFQKIDDPIKWQRDIRKEWE